MLNMREHLNGPEHLCNLGSFLLCVSQSVFGTIQRRLACPRADVDTINREVLSSFVLDSFYDFVSFFLSPPKGGH